MIRCACIFITCGSLVAQAQSTNDISLRQQRELRNQPNGLEKWSDAINRDVYIREAAPEYAWGGPPMDGTLGELSKLADVVIQATIVSKVSNLTNNGDNIETNYTLMAKSVYKGTVPSPLVLNVWGGQVILPNGHTATDDTNMWELLQPKLSYFLFLRKKNEKFELIGTGNTILIIGKRGDVHVEAREAGPDAPPNPLLSNRLKKEVEGLSALEVDQKIRAAVD